ncbi:MAG: HyaD/HybD family hydrogenase maturation endopeptidase [Desulfobacca sp.]|uniref:HyaD/HybD family hydrogenase maturation endopeptidase n=1 Tax=Desulfobacca sp. TaxID=2067990 RepID=UPI004049A531
MAITVLGIGNILMQDEGVGVHVVRQLQEHYEMPGVELVDGGTSGLDLLPFLENRERLLVVDAVDFGREPGYIGILRNEEIPALFGAKASLHHLGLMDVLAAAQLLDQAPQEVCLIGIQPQTLALGLELSAILQGKMADLVEAVIRQLEQWGIAVRRRG